MKLGDKVFIIIDEEKEKSIRKGTIIGMRNNSKYADYLSGNDRIISYTEFEVCCPINGDYVFLKTLDVFENFNAVKEFLVERALSLYQIYDLNN